MSFIRADAALCSLGRMARTRELRLRGVSEAELTRAVRAGEILRPRQGVYALPVTPDALLHAAEHGGTVGCCEAGRLLGLWILRTPPEHHVWMGTAGTPRGGCEGCRMHWDAGRVVVGRLPPVRIVLLQIASCADEDTATPQHAAKTCGVMPRRPLSASRPCDSPLRWSCTTGRRWSERSSAR